MDRLGKVVRRHVRGEDRRVALDLLEQLRGANLQLRVAMVDALGEVNQLRGELRALEASGGVELGGADGGGGGSSPR